jgi:arylsulfatase A-like enzyme
MFANYEEPRRSYAAFVATLDEKIGKVVGTIDKLGLREDTIIIFFSDHGHSEEKRNNWEGSGGSSGPYRGHKFTLWEGGVRVPCIVSWPGHVPAGAVRDQMAISFDWMPTIAQYCGVELPDRRIDGRNIGPLLESAQAESPHDVLHWETGRDQWAVRRGDWKIVHNGSAGEFEGRKIPQVETFLANLAKDKSETTNFAEDHPEIVAELTRLHEQWAKEVEEQ